MKIKPAFKKKIATSLFVSTFFSSTLLLFGPSHIYFTNKLEYSFQYIHILPYIFGITIFTTILFSIILSILKLSTHKILVSLLLSIALLLWIQGNILVWDYGLFDGSKINWITHQIQGSIDIICWILLILIALKKSTNFYKISKKISKIFILIQLMSFLSIYLQLPKDTRSTQYSLDTNGQFDFSPKRNVIILVVDTFQSDIFQEIIDEDDYYRNIFDNFTYFRNSVGGFPKTYASIPLILTGQHYDNSIPIQQFVKTAYQENSLPKILKENDYQVDLFPMVEKTIYIDPSIASNITNTRNKNINTKILEIYDVSLFRYLPQILKKYIYNNQVWLIRNIQIDKLFYQDKNTQTVDHGFTPESLTKVDDFQFINKILIESNTNQKNQNIFKFFHLVGLHQPLSYNEDLKLEKLDTNRVDYKKQAKGTLKLTEMFLNKLKEIDAYDNSLIFVIGDHGVSEWDIGFNPNTDNPKNISNLEKAKQGGIPLILVKTFNSDSSKKLIISNAPITLADIPATVMSELKLEKFDLGQSMFDIKETSNRQRRYLYYSHPEDWLKQYFLPMTEYYISGHSWEDQSWNQSGQIFSPKNNSKIIKTTTPYKINSSIKFGNEENYLQYQQQGWSWGEDSFTWTDGPIASLKIPLEKPNEDLVLVTYLSPYKNQTINIVVNQEQIGQWQANIKGDYHILLPKEKTKTSPLNIVFEFPNAKFPQNFDQTNDQRQLGAAFYNLSLHSSSDQYRYGQKIQFGKNGNAQKYKRSGWSGGEIGFAWTNGKESNLGFVVNQPQSNLILKAYIKPFLEGKQQQRVNIYINRIKVGSWQVRTAGEYQITIPKAYIENNYLGISFNLPDAVSPLSLGLYDDQRTLAIAFEEMIISEK